jgi:hypothetical protein
MVYLLSALYVSAVVLFALPLFGCTLITCEPHDGFVSISSVIQVKPLNTIYAFWGAVFLTTLTYYQIHSRSGLNVLFAVVGSKFLAVPLFLPFGSTRNDMHHYVFALIGFGLEFAYMCGVCYDAFSRPVCYDAFSRRTRAKGVRRVYAAWTFAVIAVVLLGTSLLPTSNAGYRNVAIIIAEYLFGSCLLACTMVSYKYRL